MAGKGADFKDDADGLFDDEQELMAAGERSDEGEVGAALAVDRAVSKKNAGREGAAARRGASDSEGSAPARQAPPFWMVLAIAGVSLVLGVVIGYLLGTSATIAELSSQNAAAGEGTSEGVSMPEGHPDLDVAEDGTASVAEGGESGESGDAAGASTPSDPLTLANNYFDMGMAAMAEAKDAAAQAQAASLFERAVGLYDEYLTMHESPSAEVDRAICVFYSGDHEAAIADLEAFVEKDATFAPAWANLGMFYESHDETAKAVDAYEHALKAAEKEDTYGVRDYAQQRLDALSK